MVGKNKKTYKVNTDGRDVALSVGVVSKSKKQTTLADTRVANEQQLEKVIAARWGLSDNRLDHVILV